VDLNAFNGTRADLASLWNGPGTKPVRGADDHTVLPPAPAAAATGGTVKTTGVAVASITGGAMVGSGANKVNLDFLGHVPCAVWLMIVCGVTIIGIIFYLAARAK
jgi:hypothetical protein